MNKRPPHFPITNWPLFISGLIFVIFGMTVMIDVAVYLAFLVTVIGFFLIVVS